MDKVYHWIGLVVFWSVGGIIQTAYLWLAISWLYRKVYKGSWLYYLIDYIKVYVKYSHYPNSDLSGRNLFFLERRLKISDCKNPFGKDMLELFPIILSLNPKERVKYKNAKADFEEEAELELFEYGWGYDSESGFYFNIKHVDSLYNLVFCDIYEAWELQNKWDKEKKKIK